MARKKCPKNTLCLNKTIIAVYILIGIVSFMTIHYVSRMKDVNINVNMKSNKNMGWNDKIRHETYMYPMNIPNINGLNKNINQNSVYENTYLPPTKHNWQLDNIHRRDGEMIHRELGIRQDVGQVPINVSTSYYTNYEYKQVGILTRVDEYDQQRERETILALFGRPLHRARNKWQYYTMTDKSNSIKLPIKSKGRSCNSPHGCDEIYTDDVVYVEGYKEPFKVYIYETETLEYRI